jgi:undecaprenyl-diphosphatase
MNFTWYELRIVEFVQKLSVNPIIDKVFIYISYLGEAYLFIAVALLIFWLIDKKWAYQFVTAFLGSTIIVGGLKVAFKRLRPYQDSNIVRSIGTPATESYGELSYSMPSGHSSTASSISIGVLKKSKNKFVNFLMILNIILIPFSRIYLGQHYLTDVLAGIALGFLAVTLVYWLFSKTEKEEWIGFALVPLFVAGMAVILFLKIEKLYNKQLFQAAGAFIAFALGYWFEKKVIKFEPKDKRVGVQIFKFIFGIAVVVALQQGLKYLLPYAKVSQGESIPRRNLGFDAIRYFIIAGWATVGAPLFFKILFRSGVQREPKVKKVYRERIKLPYQRA